jgi:hypothetical protein
MQKGGGEMNIQEMEDVKDMALKLDEIRTHCPEDYFYLKGWIHYLLQKEEKGKKQISKSVKQMCRQ